MTSTSKDTGSFKDGIENILTFDELVGIAKKITGDEFVRILDYKLSDYSEDKLGFTATHHTLTITVQKSNATNRETISAFVKIVSLPDEFTKNVDFNSLVAERESFLINTLNSQFKKYCQTEKWCPVHYYTTNNVLVMENLKSDGYKLIEDFIDNEMVLKSVLASLARFHSCSILTEANMSQDAKCPTTLNEHYKDTFIETIFLLSGDGASWFKSAIKLTCSLAQHFGYDPIKIQDLFNRVCDMVKPSKTHKNTVCHGDVHSKNMMFADNGSTQPKCILVDFQTYRYAPLVTDILQFLHIHATRTFREKHEESLIEYYHSVLVETIGSNDSTKMAEIPTLEDIFKGMEDLRLYGLVIASIYHPIFFLDPELMKKHARDSEFNKNLIIGDRTDFTFAHMKSNEFFRNKVEEAIRELVEKSG